MKKVIITISDEEAPLIEEYDGNLTGRKKRVSFYELAMLFAAYVNSENHLLAAIPKLPDLNVVGMKIYNNRMDFVIFLPAQFRQVIYYNDVFNVGFPNLLMVIGISNRFENMTVEESKIFAVKEDSPEAINGDTILFHYPYSNVYPTGDICWGNFSLPKVEVTKLDQIVRLFFALPSTDDLFLNREYKKSYREFLMQWNETPFDNSFLIPTKLTYKQLFKD